MQHFLLTRYNLGNIDDDWLNHRYKMFSKYTSPTVSGQTNKNFKWLIFIDHRTPEKHIDNLDLIRPSNSEIIKVDLKGTHFLKGEYARTFAIPFVKARCVEDWIITTRLDSDDAIGNRFIEEIHKSFSLEPSIIDFPHGYVKVKDRFTHCKYKTNMFISLVEKRDSLRTVFNNGHRKWLLENKYNYIANDYKGWLHVYHDRNYGSKKRRVITDEVDLFEILKQFNLEPAFFLSKEIRKELKHSINKQVEFRTICEVLREIYYSSDCPSIRLKSLEAMYMAKRMNKKLVEYWRKSGRTNKKAKVEDLGYKRK